MSVPAGVIIAWPGAAADIPAGWDRVADLDEKFPRGSVVAGATGGNETHTHTTQPHRHGCAGQHHTHPESSGSTASAGTVSAKGKRDTTQQFTTPGGGVYYDTYSSREVVQPGGHTHDYTIPVNSSTYWLTPSYTSYTTATLVTGNHLPQYRDVIWIESDGTPDGIPDGAVCFGQAIPTDWSSFATGKFLRGAAAGDDGGGTGGNATHTHVANSHTHTPPAHYHESVDSDVFEGTVIATVMSWDNNYLVHKNHYHALGPKPRIATLAGATPSISNQNNDPFHVKLWAAENATGDDDYPVGIICLWDGAVADIPTGWVICNGANGTPILTGNRLIKDAAGAGEVGVAAGISSSHGHTAASHNHTGSHTHTLDPSANTLGRDLQLGTVYTGMATHKHAVAGSTNAGTAAVASTVMIVDYGLNMPPYRDMIFIMLVEAPEEIERREVSISDCDTLGVAIGHVDLSLPGLEIIECDTIPTHDLNHFVPGNAPWDTIADAGIALQRYGSGLVIAVIPDSPGDCNILSVARQEFDKDGGATVIAGSWETVAMEVDSRLSFLVAMLLEGDGGDPEAFRWHHSVGQWDPTENGGAGGWVFTTPEECDTDPTGDFPNALVGSNGSIRRLPDGSYLFALIDEDEDMRLFRCRDMSIDGSGIWAEV